MKTSLFESLFELNAGKLNGFELSWTIKKEIKQISASFNENLFAFIKAN